MRQHKFSREIPDKPSGIKRYLSITLFFLLIYAAGRFTRFSLSELFDGMSEGGGLIKEMFFPPDWAYMRRLLEPMQETIQISIVGTFFGSIVAIPLAIVSARNFLRNPILTGIFRNFLGIFRTIPALVFAALFASIFGFGSFPGILALIVFTAGLVAKLGFEAIESIDPGPVEALESSGASKLSILRFAIIPQILPQYLSFILYSFEINIRASAVLGYVGAGGIANYYNRTLSYLQYARAGSIVLMTFVVVMLLDLVSSKIRERLL